MKNDQQTFFFLLDSKDRSSLISPPLYNATDVVNSRRQAALHNTHASIAPDRTAFVPNRCNSYNIRVQTYHDICEAPKPQADQADLLDDNESQRQLDQSPEWS